MNSWSQNLESSFLDLQKFLFPQLLAGEELRLWIKAEDSTFVRWNGGRVRQNTTVEQAMVGLTLQKGLQRVSANVSWQTNQQYNQTELQQALQQLREELKWSPVFAAESPLGNAITSSHHLHESVIDVEQITQDIATLSRELRLDLAGVFIAGNQAKGVAHSLGQSHFHSQRSFVFDYSLYGVNKLGENKAVKASYAGEQWDVQAFLQKLNIEAAELQTLLREPKDIKPGNYRVYLAPSAVHELAKMWSWAGFSEKAHRLGYSNLSPWIKGDKVLSPHLQVYENFGLEACPRFNSLGELPPEKLTIVENGRVKNTLVATSTALEFGITSTQAEPGEYFRSMEIAGGNLSKESVLTELDQGLWLSELHYVNWSDQQSARVTGMTRFGCFWVENGKIQAPIRDLRFDVSFYEVFGAGLLGLTQEQQLQPSTDTYFWRGLGAAKTPGALIRDFHFSL